MRVRAPPITPNSMQVRPYCRIIGTRVRTWTERVKCALFATVTCSKLFVEGYKSLIYTQFSIFGEPYGKQEA